MEVLGQLFEARPDLLTNIISFFCSFLHLPRRILAKVFSTGRLKVLDEKVLLQSFQMTWVFGAKVLWQWFTCGERSSKLGSCAVPDVANLFASLESFDLKKIKRRLF